MKSISYKLIVCRFHCTQGYCFIYREVFVGSTIQASIMQFSTLDPNHFYVGTDRVSYLDIIIYGTHFKSDFYFFISVSFVHTGYFRLIFCQ